MYFNIYNWNPLFNYLLLLELPDLTTMIYKVRK